MKGNPEDMPLWGWVAIALVLLCQSTWLFWDARKRDSRAWFWGLWGLIQFPWPLVTYWFLVRKIYKRRIY